MPMHIRYQDPECPPVKKFSPLTRLTIVLALTLLSWGLVYAAFKIFA
jgi:hypothetical protein